MENELLEQIINQINRYDLKDLFSNKDEIKNWASKLTMSQINNFISLDIELDEINNLKHLLINSNLLSCEDYKKRVDAIATLKNGNGCWHLFDVICKPNFLQSENFYNDIKMLSKAETARFGLRVLGKDDFINSRYHEEDLRLIVETHDTNKEKISDFTVLDALATVAGNALSIASPFHQDDMILIATIGSDKIQFNFSNNLSDLAINKESLVDNYHLENMKILAEKPLASKFLYEIMTDPNVIKRKTYRKEVEALLNAKSKLTARALYYYIVNPKEKFTSDREFYYDYKYDAENAPIINLKSVSGKEDSDYIKNLIQINKIDDKFVMHYVSLLMNPNFINSPSKKFDLELLKAASNKSIFMDLYKLMQNEVSLNSIHHKKDAVLISQTIDNEVRKLLLEKAIDEKSLKSDSHEYEMGYISRLDYDRTSKSRRMNNFEKDASKKSRILSLFRKN